MSEVFSAVLLAIVIGICLSAFFNILHVLFPTRTERTRQAAGQSPIRAFFLGLVNFLFFGALCLGLLALGENVHRIFLIPGLFIFILTCIGVTFGLSGIVQLTGDRLFPEKPVLVRTGWATGIIYLACLTPFVGWFGLTLYLGLLGLGAFILSFFQTTLPVEER